MKLEIKDGNVVTEVVIISLGLKCKNCGKTWGIRVENFDNFEQMGKEKFVCMDCFQKMIKNNSG
jgi:hypothetical protein